MTMHMQRRTRRQVQALSAYDPIAARERALARLAAGDPKTLAIQAACEAWLAAQQRRKAAR